MNYDDLIILIDKIENNIATDVELLMLDQFYESFEQRKGYFDAIEDQKAYEDLILGRIYNRLEPKKRNGLRLWPHIGIAAVLATIIFGAGLFYFQKISVKPQHVKFYTADVAAGGNKAVLKLSNGKTIQLNSNKIGLVVIGSTFKYNDGSEVSKAHRERHINKIATNDYNIVTTPWGGTYQITLPDQSRVWLNAASEIKFPASFDGMSSRTVEVNGEAYFEISKDKDHPFIVKTANQKIQVLGTHFNVQAYEDESINVATLVEGSIEVSSNYSAVKRVILPGEQAILNHRSRQMTIQKADTEDATAWKNGYFVFNHEDLESILRKVSRWYNVEIVYTERFHSFKLGGRVSRTKNLSAVLKAMELTDQVHFKIEGRRIIVMK